MSSPKGAFSTSIGGTQADAPQGGRAARARRGGKGRRRGRVARYVLGGFVALLAGAGLTAGPVLLQHAAEPGRAGGAAADDAEDVAEPAAGEPQRRLLLVTVDEEEGPATSVTLLAGPTGEVPASALFLPTSTLVSVPGFGLDQLASAHRYGGADLVRAAVENALSVHVDRVAVVTQPAFAEFLDRAGELTVDVGERLVERAADGSATVRFERGEQALDGSALADLWRYEFAGDDEFGAFRRRQQILENVFGAAVDERVRDRLVADGAPQLRTDAEASWLRALVGGLSEAQDEDRLRYNLLPVERFGTSGSDERRTYRIHAADTTRLVGALFGGEQDVGASSGVRAQVLNGVGTPGVGQLVDGLVGDDVRLVLTGNANTFEYDETRLIVYDETSEAIAAAERVQAQLGVGTIQVSRQPQSIVDLTIVVGADLVEGAEHPIDGSESAD